jgi:hypothetical protein
MFSMIKQMSEPRATTKTDIALAVGAILMAVVKTAGVVVQYKTESRS